MIQFSKPRKALGKSMESNRRHEINAKEVLLGQVALTDGMWPHIHIISNT
jgi:hypothetical protein